MLIPLKIGRNLIARADDNLGAPTSLPARCDDPVLAGKDAGAPREISVPQLGFPCLGGRQRVLFLEDRRHPRILQPMRFCRVEFGV